VQVTHHNRIIVAIQEHQSNGWRLHTYSAVGTAEEIKRYLLFESGQYCKDKPILNFPFFWMLFKFLFNEVGKTDA
jgi:hypothetical protein